jgi:hypothetical protein
MTPILPLPMVGISSTSLAYICSSLLTLSLVRVAVLNSVARAFNLPKEKNEQDELK